MIIHAFYLKTKKKSSNGAARKQSKKVSTKSNIDDSDKSDIELDIFSVEEEDGLEYTKVSNAKKMLNELDPF